MKVIEYDKKYRQNFIDFNSAWIIDNLMTMSMNAETLPLKKY